MENKRRNAYDAAFKLKAVDLAAQEGNRAASRKFGVNESLVRRWRLQREELSRCKKTTKAFRGHKSRWPELENVLEDWVNTQRADGRGVSTVQIRLKAQTLATERNIDDFKGGPSWCLRFMRRKGLSSRTRATLRQQLPVAYEEEVANFQRFTQTQIAENSIGPDDIISVAEVPLTLDLPRTGTGHRTTHVTCVLSCAASGRKLPPMAIFERMTVPKEKLPEDLVVRVNAKGWMTDSLMKEWLAECYGRRPGGFCRRKKALLVLDSTRAHVADSVTAAIKRTNSIPAVIPGGTAKYLHPLDDGVTRAFKAALRVEREAWVTGGEKSFTKSGRMRRATFAHVCLWVLAAWGRVKRSTIAKGFLETGLLRDGEDGASWRAPLSPDESDTEKETEVVCDGASLRLFNSDTEEDCLSGFNAQEEDEDCDQREHLRLLVREERDHYRRKAAPFPPLRERSPIRREVPRSPHSRSGSSVSSRGYSPDRTKSLPFPSQQGKSVDGPDGHAGGPEHLWGALFPQSGHETMEKIPGLSREGSPHSATSNKEENHPPEGEKEEPVVVPVMEESQNPAENIQERRALAIAAKAQEIEKIYRQDCETFGMVVKMLIAKDPNLEKQLQVPLRENLGEIRERCLEDLKHFINELDEVVRQPEASVCDSTTPSTSLASHKLSKTGNNHSSSY